MLNCRIVCCILIISRLGLYERNSTVGPYLYRHRMFQHPTRRNCSVRQPYACLHGRDILVCNRKTDRQTRGETAVPVVRQSTHVVRWKWLHDESQWNRRNTPSGQRSSDEEL